jgi:hypothetical protein
MKSLGLIGIGVLAIGLLIWGSSGETAVEIVPQADKLALATTQPPATGEETPAHKELEPERERKAPDEPDLSLKAETSDTKAEVIRKTGKAAPHPSTEDRSPRVDRQPAKPTTSEKEWDNPSISEKNVEPERIPSPPRPVSEIQVSEETPPAAPHVIVPPSPPRRSTEGAPERPGPVFVANIPEKPDLKTAILPAGSVIEVRTAERISSQSHISGDVFEATLTGDLSVNGKVVVNRGSEVTGRLLEVVRPGKVKGRGSVTFDLREMRGNESAYTLKTNSITIEAESSKSKDAAKVGAATAIGAVLGAVFGGKKGAAVGGATAGGAGVAGVLLSRGKDVEIPAERLFSFRLEEDVEISYR